MLHPRFAKACPRPRLRFALIPFTPRLQYVRARLVHSFAPMALGAPEDIANWERVGSPQFQSGGYSVYTKPIEKAEQDDRDYRLIQLDNKLQVLLVSDPKADKAAASLDVGVGHLHDPVRMQWGLRIRTLLTLAQKDMPGLAHFCEHLLFMVRGARPRFQWRLTHEACRARNSIPRRMNTLKCVAHFLASVWIMTVLHSISIVTAVTRTPSRPQQTPITTSVSLPVHCRARFRVSQASFIPRFFHRRALLEN
jgi:hypothetical protein